MQNVRDNVRVKQTPIPVQRSTRRLPQRVLSSFKPGVMMPLAVIPLLREDSLAGAMFNIGFEQMETVEVLMNAVNVRVRAVLVPKLAFDRYDGMDSLNKSYMGIPPAEGVPVVPWFETMVAPAHGANPILTALGMHAKPGTTINSEYIEVYNQVWNWFAKNRSPDLTLRDRLDTTLAPAFWVHQNFSHIVPDFDQASIDGEVGLRIMDSRLPVKGLGLHSGHIGLATTFNVNEHGQTKSMIGWADAEAGSPGSGFARFVVEKDPGGLYPQLFAEMRATNATISLADIEAAKKTAAFAQLRKQYNGHTDDYIIDLLMGGISIPEQAWKHPITLFDQSTIFGMSKRYATDSGNMTESVVNGATGIQARFSCPRVPCGGVIMIVCEVTPEQLFERQRDPYLHLTSTAKLPEFQRDFLDPEKVVIVENSEIDTDHDNPDDAFGYAPLNHEWMRAVPRIGGKFYRPAVDASFDEDRQRIWAVETQNPTLSEDFYLCTTMHTKPFLVSNQDQYEVLLRGEVAIVGNTVFGANLIEASDDYEKVAAKVPSERIEK